ncbi:MAG TPA: BolA family transcriptional regulator [Candidatus Limnocylindrales bacterium]|nr:BolA family transcriptional regulator [Candidatus Limnocylindrales bacterium]
MEAARIQELIRSAIPDSEVRVVDTHGSGDHFDVVVVSPAFAGQSLVQQHRMVYGALGDNMRRAIHALALRTLTPEQYRQELVSDIETED